MKAQHNASWWRLWGYCASTLGVCLSFGLQLGLYFPKFSLGSANSQSLSKSTDSWLVLAARGLGKLALLSRHQDVRHVKQCARTKKEKGKPRPTWEVWCCCYRLI